MGLTRRLCRAWRRVCGALLVLGAPAFACVAAAQDYVRSGVASIRTVQLRFDDRSDGSVIVTRATDGKRVATLAPGEDGFVRGVMRGLVRDRKRAGAGPMVPFVLAVHGDGSLAIEDPVTSRRVHLEAFGRDNVRAFARFFGNDG